MRIKQLHTGATTTLIITLAITTYNTPTAEKVATDTSTLHPAPRTTTPASLMSPSTDPHPCKAEWMLQDLVETATTTTTGTPTPPPDNPYPQQHNPTKYACQCSYPHSAPPRAVPTHPTSSCAVSSPASDPVSLLSNTVGRDGANPASEYCTSTRMGGRSAGNRHRGSRAAPNVRPSWI